MLDNLTQETINQYATDAQAIDEPLGADWTRGVAVGRTIPAKWWNWLFSAITKRLGQAKADSSSMLAELKNTVTGAGITIDPTDNTQLKQAVNVEGQNGVSQYVDYKKGFFTKWTTEPVEGIRSFGASDTITIERLEQFPGSEGKAFFLQIKQHTTDPVADYYWNYSSPDLLHWNAIGPTNGAELQTADIAYYKGKCYFLCSVKDSYTAQLYSSEGAVSWNLAQSFNEYGALGLRIVNDVLWMISASSLTYAGVDYYSYRSTNGSSWTSAGAIFRNPSGITDTVSDVLQFGNKYIIGNKITADGLNWSVIVTAWANTAYNKAFITSNGAALIQFDAAGESAWYTLETPTSSPVKRTGTWKFMIACEGNILAADLARNNKMGVTTDGVSLTDSDLDYPVNENPSFFRSGEHYIFYKYMTDNLIDDWRTPYPIPSEVQNNCWREAGIGYYIIAGTYFSATGGDNPWLQGSAAGVPFCAVPVYIDSIATCMSLMVQDTSILRCMTFNGVNRVIGTTLYLR